MKYRLDNKTVILTGASSGIGKEIAFRLIRHHSCTVIAIARNEERLLKVKAELGELSDKYIVCSFDASVKENWVKLASDFENSDTPVDILINCAGVLPKFKAGQTSDEIKNIFEINFFSQVYACEAIIPMLKRSTDGAIINFSSSSALCPFGGVSAYTASKAALERYTAALACESKLLISCVLPGFIKTDIMKNQGASDSDSKLFNKISASPERAVKKILRRIKRRKSRIIVGADAHLMNLTFKLFPKRAPKLITWFLRKTGLEIFKEI